MQTFVFRVRLGFTRGVRQMRDIFGTRVKRNRMHEWDFVVRHVDRAMSLSRVASGGCLWLCMCMQVSCTARLRMQVIQHLLAA